MRCKGGKTDQGAWIRKAADFAGWWSLDLVTGALSALAEIALRAAVGLHLRQLHAKGELVLPNPAKPLADCGLIILDLGKLGARELNYSSDIDLMNLIDPEKFIYPSSTNTQECFVGQYRIHFRILQDVSNC